MKREEYQLDKVADNFNLGNITKLFTN
ncbi:hypothetical protein LYNGBM3L_41010 [Moorena producens 3L]|uniref:Uncharacterized protein n=1 Tax=Moorena producens 3L TaxID=489825 RepID=F4XVU0_9CYAN|nr:hypothetical protein LYNGBM3L_41010 [Moorena producens 3L]